MRPDTGVVAVSLSELQKVSAELVAASRRRSFSNPRICYRRQVSITRDERN